MARASERLKAAGVMSTKKSKKQTSPIRVGEEDEGSEHEVTSELNRETADPKTKGKGLKRQRETGGDIQKMKVSPKKKEKGKEKEYKNRVECSDHLDLQKEVISGENSRSQEKKVKGRRDKKDNTVGVSKEKNKGTRKSRDMAQEAAKRHSDDSNSEESSDGNGEEDSITKCYSDTSSDIDALTKKRSKNDKIKKEIVKKDNTMKDKGKGKANDEENSWKVQMSEEYMENKDEDYFMSYTKRTRPLKINLCSKSGVMELVRKTLEEKCEAKFRSTCFGHFWDFSFKKTSSQLLLHLIQNQCKPKKTSELNFKIGGKVLKFGLREFALVTGLNCGPIPEIYQDTIKGKGKLKNDYFEFEESVTRNCLNIAFKFSKMVSENDRVKMAQLYYLESFLLPRQEKVHIEMEHLLMVDDDQLFNTYPWGRVAFNLLLRYMKNSLDSQGTSGIGMGGFIHALLAWAYEVIPALSSQPTYYAKRIRNTVPRMINWEADTQPEWRELQANVFKSPSLEVLDLEPTTEELQMPYFKPFLQDELTKRGLVVNRLIMEGDRKETDKFFVGSSSMESQMRILFKKQDETNEKLDGLVNAINNLVAYLKNDDEDAVKVSSRFMMQEDVGDALGVQAVHKDGATLAFEIDKVDVETRKTNIAHVDDHGLKKQPPPFRRDDDDGPSDPHKGDPNVHAAVHHVTIATGGASGGSGGTNVNEGSVQECDSIDETINKVILSIDESKIMEELKRDKKAKMLMTTTSMNIPKVQPTLVAPIVTCKTRGVKISDTLPKQVKKRPALVEINRDLAENGKGRAHVYVEEGYVGGMRGSYKKDATDDLPVEFCNPSFDLKLSQSHD